MSISKNIAFDKPASFPLAMLPLQVLHFVYLMLATQLASNLQKIQWHLYLIQLILQAYLYWLVSTKDYTVYLWYLYLVIEPSLLMLCLLVSLVPCSSSGFMTILLSYTILIKFWGF